MRPVRIFCLAALAAILAGCASSVSAPTVVQPLPAESRISLKLSGISANADAGVSMTDADFSTICQEVRAYIESQTPGVFTDETDSGHSLQMKIHFTRFDRGDAVARAILIGLGQIKIEATVTLEEMSGKQVAQYRVAKDFALGGLAGAVTRVEDVEDGFAKSVAEVVKLKQ